MAQVGLHAATQAHDRELIEAQSTNAFIAAAPRFLGDEGDGAALPKVCQFGFECPRGAQAGGLLGPPGPRLGQQVPLRSAVGAEAVPRVGGPSACLFDPHIPLDQPPHLPRTPALVLIMLGGNEVKRLQWRRSTMEKVERDLHRFIQRITAPRRQLVRRISSTIST